MLKATSTKPHSGKTTPVPESDGSDSSGFDSLEEDLDQIGRFNLPKLSNYLMGENFPLLRNLTSNLGVLPSLPPLAPAFQSQLSSMSSNLPNLSNVNLLHLPDLPDVSKYISQTIKQLSRSSEAGDAASFNGSSQLSDHRKLINSIKTTVATRIQMNTFLADLRNGLSFQAALHRLQTLTDVVHEAITLPVEDEGEDDESDAAPGARDQETEPVGVLRVVNREQPLVNDLVVPDDEFPKSAGHVSRRAKKRWSKANGSGDLVYDSGTNTTDWEVSELTAEESRALTQLDLADDFFKQDLLRGKIQNIQNLDLSQHLKNKLVTKLMMGNYLNYVNQKAALTERFFGDCSPGARSPREFSADESAGETPPGAGFMPSGESQDGFSGELEGGHFAKFEGAAPGGPRGIQTSGQTTLGKNSSLEKSSSLKARVSENIDSTAPDWASETNSVSSDMSVDEVVLSEADTVPSYYDKSKGVLGCQHYQRNCKLECPTCSKWYVCRFCHDADIVDHKLVRKEVKHILCMSCGTPQAPETNYCVNCEEELANYFCLKCVLYDNDGLKDIYHCDKCGICRLGLGLSKDYFHCDTCNICLSIDLKHRHKCVTNTTHCDCPICNEYLFTSVSKVVFMKCGHSIHQQCYDEMTKHSYKCPICKKTVVNTETQFRILDQEIRQLPLPPPYDKWRCIISCNDCKGKSNCAYHVMGLKCKYCHSYNTNQLKLSKPEESDDEDDLEQDDNDARITSMRLIKTNLSSNFLMNDQTESAVEKQEPAKMQETEGDLMKLKALKRAEVDRSSIASIFQKFINNTLANYDERMSEREDSDMETFGF